MPWLNLIESIAPGIAVPAPTSTATDATFNTALVTLTQVTRQDVNRMRNQRIWSFNNGRSKLLQYVIVFRPKYNLRHQQINHQINLLIVTIHYAISVAPTIILYNNSQPNQFNIITP